MPIYVYKNLDTGETFEYQQSISEAALKTHPETGAPVTRLIQPVGIAFKGSGFYVNDSRSGNKSSGKSSEASSDSSKSEAKGETNSEAKAETKTETKTETKSETKSEAKPAVSSSSS
ncbi:MAG: FmdB family zinc ribbon protein [Deinococcales bacterium]